MKFHEFDEDLRHRKILPYDPVYREIFLRVKQYVEKEIADVELFLVGSTAIPDLRGKPMLDIFAVTAVDNLRQKQREFFKLGFHSRDVWTDRDDKPYICGSIELNGNIYNINIHICKPDYRIFHESLAFIEILNNRPDLRRRYESVKEAAHNKEPADAERYNQTKEYIFREILNEKSPPAPGVPRGC